MKSISLPKFLVTFGFMKLQQSKIDSAGVRHDFNEVIVVDPEISKETKRDVFVRLMEKYGYKADEIRKWLDHGKDVYVYFNNTIGDASRNLQTLRKMVELS